MPEVNVNSAQFNAELLAVLDAVVVDVTALATALDVATAKLNADGGVTDTDYSTANAAAVTITSD